MHHSMNQLLWHRAKAMANRIAPFIGESRTVIDIGCGMGHNAAALSQRYPNAVFAEADVVNMKTVGDAPLLLKEGKIPADDDAFDCGLMLFVLHYPADPKALLAEACRTCRRVIVLQSTYVSRFERALLGCREWLQGRGAFAVAKQAKLIPPVECPLRPSTYMTHNQIHDLFAHARLRVVHHTSQYIPFTRLSRDLFVLERAEPE